jgi:chemotaxis protein CheD
VMLPGKSPAAAVSQDLRFAHDALFELVRTMEARGACRKNLHATVAGGGNVLRHENDTVCDANVYSVRETLANLKIPVRAQSTGGYNRRKILLETLTGQVFYAEGDEGEALLYWHSEKSTSL